MGVSNLCTRDALSASKGREKGTENQMGCRTLCRRLGLSVCIAKYQVVRRDHKKAVQKRVLESGLARKADARGTGKFDDSFGHLQAVLS